MGRQPDGSQKNKMTTKIIQGDCLEEMGNLEAGSVDLILTDPPYGTMKGAGLDGWKGNKTFWDNAIDPKQIFKECERLLRENGTLILFSQEPYTSKLIIEAHGNLPFIYRLVWLKDHFANALISKVAPVSYFEDIIVFSKKYDTLRLNPLRLYFKQVLDYIGLNLREINKRLGHRKAEHTFYVTPRKALIGELGQKIDHATRCGSMQFGLCTEETYTELITIFEVDKMGGFLNFAQLKEMNLKQEKIFNLPEGQKIKSNVLKYKKDYQGLHPTQKPVELLKDLIKTYSNEGDIVLDFTMGSGSTLIACQETNRKGIGIELDEGYFKIAEVRIESLKDLKQQILEEKK